MLQHFRNAVASGLVLDDDDALIDWMRLSSYVVDQSERDDKHQAFAPNLLFIRLAEDRDFRGTKENEQKAKEAIQRIKTYRPELISAPGLPP